MHTSTMTRVIAIPLGVAVLAVQIGIGLDYLGGWGKANPIDISSMVLVFVALAVAPTLIVGAVRMKHPLVALGLVAGFACWITYSLPTTLGRTAELSEVKVQTAEQISKASADKKTLIEDALIMAKARLTIASEDLKNAQRAANARCVKTPNSDACRNLKKDEDTAKTWEADRLSRVDDLMAQSNSPPPPVTIGDVGSSTLAWAISIFWKPVTAESVRNSKNIGFAVGLELFLWSLLHLGLCPPKTIRSETTARLQEPQKTELEHVPTFSGNVVPIAVHPVVRALHALGGEASSNRELAAKMHVSDGESSKRVDEVEALGLVEREQSGKEVRIRLKRIA